MLKQLLTGESGEVKLALLKENDAPAAFYAERKDRPLRLFDVYRARVENVKPNGMSFLNFGDGTAVANFAKNAVKAGDLVTVSIVKDYGNDKFPLASEGISIRTAYLMYGTPGKTRASGKLTAATREKLLTAAEREGLTERVSFRTRCEELDDAGIRAAVLDLKMRLDALKTKEKYKNAPGEVLKTTFESRAEMHFNTRPEESVFADFDAAPEKEILKSARSMRVELDKIGNLLIERTEAFASIDVNTAGEFRFGSEEETAYRTNLAAAQAAARETILRNLSGTILIDMVSMRDAAHKEAVLQALRAEFLKEKGKTRVTGYTESGIYEIVREREGISLYEAFMGDRC